MIDLERIQRLAEKLGNRKDSLEIVRQMRCGGKKFDGGGDKYQARDNTRVSSVVSSGVGYVPAEERSIIDRSSSRLDDGPTGFVPLVGDILQAGQAWSDLLNKRYKQAALGAGLLLLPNVVEKGVVMPVVRAAARNKAIKNSDKLYDAAQRIIENAKKRNEFLDTDFAEFPEFGKFLEETKLEPSQGAIDEFAKRQGTSARGVHVPEKARPFSQRQLEILEQDGLLSKELDDMDIPEVLDLMNGVKLTDDEKRAITEYFLTHSKYKDRHIHYLFNSGGADQLGSAGVYSANSFNVANTNAAAYLDSGIGGKVGIIEMPIQYNRSLPFESQLEQIGSPIFSYDDIMSVLPPSSVSDLSAAANKAGFRLGDNAYTKFTSGRPIHERTTVNTEDAFNLIETFPAVYKPNGGDRYGILSQTWVPKDNELFIPKISTAKDVEGIVDILSWMRPYDDFDMPIFGLGGRKYPGGGKFFRTNLQQESPLMYQPMKPWMPDVSVPMRFIPEPDLGDYVPPSSTGMAENYPVTVSVPSPRVDLGFVDPGAVENVVDLFSDEAKARRRLKQRYAESRFNNKAVSKAGAQGAWQIMPITLKDYLGRGRGKAGDLNDPEYNGKIRDWVMGIIPRDLQEFWSDDDSDINKLAKLYAAYNWGAGSLRNYLRKRQKAGKSIDDPYEWVEDLNPETRRYVKYLAFDEDIPDSSYTNTAFEDAARARGYMAEGGRLYGDGGPEDDGIHLGELQPAVKLAEEPLFVDTPYTADDYFKRWYPDRREQLVGNMAKILMDRSAWPFGTKRRARKSVDGYTRSMLQNMDENLKEYSLISSIWDKAYPHNSAYDPNRKWKFPDALKDEEAVMVLDEHIKAKNDVLKSYGINTNDEIDDNARRSEGWDNYGFSYSNDPYHIFYSSAWPSNGTIVHERTHTLRPLPGEYEKYSMYYGLTPMEYATNKIEQWNDNLLTEAGKNKDNKSYYTSPKEIVARLNEIRFNLGLNPKRIITLDDLKEIRRRASESEREDFLDLYTDETLLRFFNEIADAGNQESLYGNHIGNLSASGGKIQIKPSHRGRLTELKARTGKTEAELYNDGNPDHKRMVVFARNSRKWKHGDGGYLNNYFYDGGPYGVIPLGGDYLTYLQSMPEVSGGMIEPSVVTAALPAKFNGSQESARRYAEGYQKGAKPVSEAMSRVGQDIFRAADTVAGFVPGPIGMIDWLGHMGADAAEGNWGRVGRDVALATALGAGARGVGWLRNYVDDATNYGEDLFRAFTDRAPGKVSTNFTYDVPVPRTAAEAIPTVERAAQAGEWSPEELARLRAMAGDHPMDLTAYTPEQIAQAQAQMQADAPIIHDALAGNRATGPTERFVSSGPVAGAKTTSGYQIERYPGYMLKSLMEGNPLERQLSKSGEINVGNLRNYIKSKDIKAVDKAVMEKILASEEFAGKKSIDYNRFRRAVQDELITYERTPDTRWEDYGISRLGYNPDTGVIGFQEGFAKAFVKENPRYRISPVGEIHNGEEYYYIIDENGNTLSASQINRIMPELDFESYYIPREDSYTEHTFTFSSPRIPSGSSKHYDPNTLGHSRTYTTADEPDVLHVMESQSDWAQQANHGSKIKKDPMSGWIEEKNRIRRIEDSINQAKNNLANGLKPDGTPIEHEYERRSIEEFIRNEERHLPDARARLHKYELVLQPEKYVQEKYLQQEYTSRQIQENLRYAAEKGQTKMRYPTRETAAKIEGYTKGEAYFDEAGNDITNTGENLYTIGDENEKRLSDVKSKLKDYSDRFKIYLSPDGRFSWGSELTDPAITQLEEAIPRRRAAYEGWKASHPNSSSQAALKKIEAMEQTLQKRLDTRKEIKSLIAERDRLQKIEPKLKPGITRKEIYTAAGDKETAETILHKYDVFPKQFKKLYKNADVRIVTDPKGNTWYEVDVPENYLQQEWAYEDGGSMILPKMMMDKHSPDKLRKAIANIKAKRMN